MLETRTIRGASVYASSTIAIAWLADLISPKSAELMSNCSLIDHV